MIQPCNITKFNEEEEARRKLREALSESEKSKKKCTQLFEFSFIFDVFQSHLKVRIVEKS